MIKKVTLREIAADSGLSISTVSKVLSGSEKISTKNQAKVMRSAQRLQYPYFALNMPLNLRRNINIALVTRHHIGEYFASLFEGFNQAIKNTNIQMSLISISDANKTPIKVMADIVDSHFDAAVIFFPDCGLPDYKEILENVPSTFPIVSLSPVPNPVIDTITFDNYGGGFQVANHFEKSGYHKMGLISGPSGTAEAHLRKNGFLDYINTSESLSLIWEFDGDYSVQIGEIAYESYKQSKYKPDAIFCSNDSMAIGFIHRAMRDGVLIPDQVAVAGFDDLPNCQFLNPTITSVHTPYHLIGKKSIELIIKRLQEKNQSSSSGITFQIPTSLSIRESSLKHPVAQTATI